MSGNCSMCWTMHEPVRRQRAHRRPAAGFYPGSLDGISGKGIPSGGPGPVPQKSQDPPPDMPGETLGEKMASYEMYLLEEALRRNHGNITRTAKELGLQRQNLQYRIRSMGLRYKKRAVAFATAPFFTASPDPAVPFPGHPPLFRFPPFSFSDLPRTGYP